MFWFGTILVMLIMLGYLAIAIACFYSAFRGWWQARKATLNPPPPRPAKDAEPYRRLRPLKPRKSGSAATPAPDRSAAAPSAHTVRSEKSGEGKALENATLTLLKPAPEERLQAWLSEFYGKPVRVSSRESLRHRDLSMVERLCVEDGLPTSLIYKQVLPPWDVEQDLHERVLIPSISNSAQLFMSANCGPLTAMFMEDLGDNSLKDRCNADLAAKVGKELAKMHRAYSYRTDELVAVNVLPTLFPIDYEEFAHNLSQHLAGWNLITPEQTQELKLLAELIAVKLAGEPISLVHGDLYAENLMQRGDRLYIIDWSWFTLLGVPAMDLATLTMDHFKNGSFGQWKDVVIDAYCFESGRDLKDIQAVLPPAETLSRLLFLHWLVVRRSMGIMGTTVGPVDDLIKQVLSELSKRLALLPA